MDGEYNEEAHRLAVQLHQAHHEGCVHPLVEEYEQAEAILAEQAAAEPVQSEEESPSIPKFLVARDVEDRLTEMHITLMDKVLSGRECLASGPRDPYLLGRVHGLEVALEQIETLREEVRR